MLATRALALLLLAPASLAQTNFVESEPNSIKAEATPIDCMRVGDTLSGTTSGSDATPGSSAMSTVDVFRIRTCALPPGVYAHILEVQPPGVVATLLGKDQVGIPGSGGTPGGADVVLQTSTALDPDLWWYGSGQQEEVYVRISSSSGPVAYSATLYTGPQFLDWIGGTFQPGPVTISTVGLTSIDTEIVLYDSSFAEVGANDDEYPVASKQSRLTRALAPGTYYLAVHRSNMASASTATADEGFPTGGLLDLPGAVASTAAGSVPLIQFTISDGTTALTGFAAGTLVPFQILWRRFTVGAQPITPFCFGDGSGLVCPCGPAAVGHGCPNSASSAGGRLDGAGAPSVSADSFAIIGTDLPNTIALYFQGSSYGWSPQADGILCIYGSNVIRLGTATSSNGGSQYPGPGGASISVQGAIPGPGATRYYEAWYRDPSAFCTSATSNYTNALRVVWGP